MEAAKRVLSVGQCAADHGAITRTLQKLCQAEVVPADHCDEALALLRGEDFDLVLVNRIFDADGFPGLDLVGLIKSEETLRHLPVMLVSNYDEAQRQAEALGALPGFGKAGLGGAAMIACVKAVLG
jgi:two-component system chemotaxis response regulator CheY